METKLSVNNETMTVSRNQEGEIVAPFKWPRNLEYDRYYGLKDVTQEELVKTLYEENPEHTISCEGAVRAVMILSGVQIKRPNLEKWFDRVFVSKGILHKTGLIIDGSVGYSLNTEKQYCLYCWNEHKSAIRDEVYIWDREDHLRRYHHFRDQDFAFGGLEMSFIPYKPTPKTEAHEWEITNIDLSYGKVTRKCKVCETEDTAYFRGDENNCGGVLEASWDKLRSERIDKVIAEENRIKQGVSA